MKLPMSAVVTMRMFMVVLRCLTLLFSRTVRHDCFHEFEFILIFPFCPQLFSSGAMQNSRLGKTAPRDKLIPNPKARLREQVREVMRFHHYSLRTEEAHHLPH